MSEWVSERQRAFGMYHQVLSWDPPQKLNGLARSATASTRKWSIDDDIQIDGLMVVESLDSPFSFFFFLFELYFYFYFILF